MKKHSNRWVELPVSASAEQFSRVIYIMIDKLLKLTSTVNGEREVHLNSVIVHETDTGYAQSFMDDAFSHEMGIINLHEIIFSDEVKADWEDSLLWDKIVDDVSFVNPQFV